MPPAWPLVGRAEELEFIERAMDRPQLAGLVVAGAAGVGKTRLAREALDRARAHGMAPEWAVATQSAKAIPLGAFSHLLPDRIAKGGSQLTLLRRAAAGLAERAGERRLMLGVDDAHLLDDVSAALLLHLAQAEDAFLLVSARSGEPTPDPVVTLWKDGLAERLELQPLSRHQAEDLLSTVLSGPVDGATFHHLWEVTQGNVLFLREMVLGGVDQGHLAQVAGVWRWKGSFTPPTGLIDVVMSRLGHLNSGQRGALELVAGGEPLGLDLVQELLSVDVVEELERRGLIEVSMDGRRTHVRLSHPLYGEAIRAQTPQVRMREIHGRLADALASTRARRRGDLLRLATWKLQAGRSDSDLFLTAARRALGTHGFGLAERLARSAAASGGTPASRNSAAARDVLGHALLGLGRNLEADSEFASVVATAPTELQRVEAAVFRAMNLREALGRPQEAWDALSEAEKYVAEGARSEIAAMRAWLLLLDSRFSEAEELIDSVLQLPDCSERARLGGTGIKAWLLNARGQHQEALSLLGPLLDELRRAVEEIPFGIFLQSTVRFVRTHAHMALGDLDRAEGSERELYAEAVEHGDVAGQGQAAWTMGGVASARGKMRTATVWLREGAALLQGVTNVTPLRTCRGDLAQCLAILGDVSAARRALLAAEAAPTPEPIFDLGVLLGRAWMCAAEGETTAGMGFALEAAELARSLNRPVWEALGLHHAVRLGAASKVAGRLAELATSVEGPLASAYADHAEALRTGSAAGLEHVARDFEDLGTLLYAAEAAAEASRAHRDQGRKGSALTWAARARGMADQCEGARTPALAELDQPLPLTPREREIATLAARGLTNRDIATRLFVSVRTVDNHLHHAYEKLGISRREELPALFSGVPSSGSPDQ